MKRMSLLAVSLILTALMAVSASAQAAQPGAGKIGWLNTSAFADEKAGIAKYLGALKQIESEMKPRVTELQALQARLKAISEDLNKMQSNPAIPVDQKAFAAEQDEGQRLQRAGEFKKKELDAAVDKRNQDLLGP